MKKPFHLVFYIFFIGLLTIFLSSCTPKPVRFLAQDACIVQKGMSPQKVIALIGEPDKKTKDGKWFYYKKESHFWQHIPLLSNFLPKEKLWALELDFLNNKVEKISYYLEKGPE